MSKKAKKNLRKKLAFQNETPLPKLGKIKEEWDLKNLYYKNGKDPRIEEDIKKAEAAYADFRKRWEKIDFVNSAEKLKRALTAYETLSGLPELSRPGRYFSFRQCLNVNDKEATSQLALLSKRLRKASDQVLFFTLRLGQVPAELQEEYLKDGELAHFRYFLERLWLSARHDLSEPEEKIIRLKANQSHSMWADAVEKIVSNRTVEWKGKKLPVPAALETVDLLPTKEKIKLWDKLMGAMKEVGEVAEHEMNAIITDARGEDELRGYKKPYSATALSYEDNEKSTENLVSAVSTRGFALSKRFYQLKAKYHRVPKLHYVQKYESIGGEPSVSFPEAVEICRSVFYGVNVKYGEIFDRMLTNGQIDVYPRPGKRGGAFMSEQTGHPVQVFLNHVSNFKSLETLAHEMGHAIHAHRSATNTPLYDGHSIITAETASTLFENLVFDAVWKQVSPQEQTILLHDRITRDIATIERQIAFFNCELEMHEMVTKQGALTNDEFANIMYRHLKSYLGPAVSVDPKDGYSYVYIPHLRFGFYVYSYAYGILMSTIMANRYKEDNAYAKEIDKFLSAGSSRNVSDIFASIGIDTKSEKTFLAALDNHENDIKTLARLFKG